MMGRGRCRTADYRKLSDHGPPLVVLAQAQGFWRTLDLQGSCLSSVAEKVFDTRGRRFLTLEQSEDGPGVKHEAWLHL